MTGAKFNHVVYWTIPQVDAGGAVVSERHYALNLSELEPAVAQKIEAMLRSYPLDGKDLGDVRFMRTDPGIVAYRHLFQPFIEVKKRAVDLCRFSMVWLAYPYTEYTAQPDGPRHHEHPSVRALAGAG